MLESIETALEAFAANPVMKSYAIGTRQYMRADIPDLLVLRDRYRNEAANEDAAAKVAAGRPTRATSACASTVFDALRKRLAGLIAPASAHRPPRRGSTRAPSTAAAPRRARARGPSLGLERGAHVPGLARLAAHLGLGDLDHLGRLRARLEPADAAQPQPRAGARRAATPSAPR
jgi:hypothetical protein